MFSDDPEDETGTDEQAELSGWAEIQPISIFSLLANFSPEKCQLMTNIEEFKTLFHLLPENVW